MPEHDAPKRQAGPAGYNTRRRLPYSPTTMAVGAAIAAGIGYFVFYKNKHDGNASYSEPHREASRSR